MPDPNDRTDRHADRSGEGRSRPVWRRLSGRLIVAPFVLPHELGHALVAALAGLPFTVTLVPEHDGPVTPLGRFDADVDRATPAWVIRLVAVAPLPIYVGVAVLLRATTTLPEPAALVALFFCAAWASLSAGDVAVAAAPEAVRRAGTFSVDIAGWEPRAADLLTVVTTLLLAVVLLA
jgi:hypothetical protein